MSPDPTDPAPPDEEFMPPAAPHHPSGRRRALLWGARLLLLGFSLGLVGVIAEVALRIQGFTAIYDVYSKPSILWRKHPLLGWHHEPNTTARYIGPRPWPIEFDNEIRINSLGLRGPELEPVPKGGKRLLVLGDSMVAAFEVPENRTWVVRASERLSRQLGYPVQVINAGVRGYGTDQSYLWYREYGHRLDADWVMFVHSTNDLRNNMTIHRMRRPFGKGAFALRENGELELIGTPVPDHPMCSHWALDDHYEARRLDGWLARAYCRIETNLTDHSALFTWATFRLRENSDLLHWIWYRVVPQQAFQPSEWPARLAEWIGPRAAMAQGTAVFESTWARLDLTGSILVALAREVKSHGAKLMVVIPEWEAAGMKPEAIRAEGAILRALILDPARIMDRPVRFQRDGHFNELGHRLIAEVVTDAVIEDFVDTRRSSQDDTSSLPETK